MLFNYGGEDEDIIEVDHYEDVHILPQNLIDYILECCRGISEAKGHYKVLKISSVYLEGSFPLFSFFYPAEVISTFEV